MSLEDISRKLRDLQRRAEDVDGEHSVPINELFYDEFMLRNTDFSSIDDMFAASGFKVETSDDFAAIPDDEWDAFVKARTRFESWEEMKKAAVQQWAAGRLGFDAE